MARTSILIQPSGSQFNYMVLGGRLASFACTVQRL